MLLNIVKKTQYPIKAHGCGIPDTCGDFVKGSSEFSNNVLNLLNLISPKLFSAQVNR